jgi:cytochrome c biogenesis protein CcdA
MVDAPLALSFTAGMLAAFNPCGFAMLPAYLSFFLGADGSAKGAVADTAHALRVGTAVTAGFVAVFGAAGVAVTAMSVSVQRYTPWATVIIGVVLVPLGIAVVLGRGPTLNLPRLQRGGSQRSAGSMALFGVSYATVSLSCTLPVFLAAVSTTFTQASMVAGLAVFVAYAAGMGVVLTGLAVAVVLARQSLVRRLRAAIPYAQRASGVLLAAAGGYVAWYGWVELRVAAGANPAAGPVDTVGRISGSVSNWITDFGPLRLGFALLLLVVATVVVDVRRRRQREQPFLAETADRRSEPGENPSGAPGAPRPASPKKLTTGGRKTS